MGCGVALWAGLGVGVAWCEAVGVGRGAAVPRPDDRVPPLDGMGFADVWPNPAVGLEVPGLGVGVGVR